MIFRSGVCTFGFSKPNTRKHNYMTIEVYVRTSLFCLLLLFGCAPAVQLPVHPNMPQNLIHIYEKAKPAYESITASDLHAGLSFLASDEMEGRGTAQRGLDMAAAFIAANFRLNGLKGGGPDGSWFQKFDLNVGEIRKDETSLVVRREGYEERFELLVDFYPSKNIQNLDLEGEVVFAGYGITAEELGYDDYDGLDVDGKIVLVLDDYPGHAEEDSWFNQNMLDWNANYAAARIKIANAQVRNARAVLLIRNWGLAARKIYDEPFMWLPESGLTKTPLIQVSRALADAVLGDLSSYDLEEQYGYPGFTFQPAKTQVKVTVEMDVRSEPSQNVIGWIEGSDPVLKNEYVVISAHYDHLGIDPNGNIYNGADDNGTGTSALLELAEALTMVKPFLKRSVVLLCVAAEEHGLLGSEYYASHPVFPMKSVVANLNIDMIGRNEPDEIFIIGAGLTSEPLEQINGWANDLSVNLNLNPTFNHLRHPMRYFFRSDHYNFARFGVPIIFYFADIHEDYHRPGDTIDKIDFEKTERVTRLIFTTTLLLSVIEDRPQITRQLSEVDFIK